MVVEALKAGVNAILLDTTGMVHGDSVRVLKEKKIKAVAPDIIAALQKEGEIKHLLTPFEDRFEISRLPAPARMKRTGMQERMLLRGFSMRKHVKGGKKFVLNLVQIVLRETLLGTGVEQLELKTELSEILKCEVLYVEKAPDALIAVVKRIYTGAGVSKLKEHYDNDTRIAEVDWLERLMLGLLNKDEKLLDIGFLKSLNFHHRPLIVSASLKDKTAVKYVKFGYLRTDENGYTIGGREISALQRLEFRRVFPLLH